MVRRKSLIENVQQDHAESRSLITQFRNALTSCKNKEAREIFERLDQALARHFEFELNYLYPRMRRLILEMTEKLCSQQEEITASIRKSQHILSRNKTNKNRLSTINDMLDMITNHLKDCSRIVSLADCFGQVEKDELDQRFKGFYGLSASKRGERR